MGWPGVCVVVVGDVAHVVVNLPATLPQDAIGHGPESLVELSLDLVRWFGVVLAPDHHGHQADLAVSNPTEIIFEVALGYRRGLAEVAVAHLTLKYTVPCHFSILPGAGF